MKTDLQIPEDFCKDEVSIIVPVYNTEEYLEQCLKSIIGQTYKNIEIIIVTEPCDDKSEEICDRFAEQDDRVRVIHKPELSGVSRSRNIGIREAKGAYLLFVDSDDYIELNMVEELLKCRKNTGADIVKCGRRILENDQIYDWEINATKDTALIFPEAFRYILGKPWESIFSGYIWDALYPADKLTDKSGALILMDETLNHSEDIHWLIRVLLNCGTIAFSSKYLYNYRRNRQGNTVSELYSFRSLKYSESAIRAYSEIYDMLSERGYESAKNAYWRIINHKFKACKAAKAINDKKSYRIYSNRFIKMLFKYAAMEHSFKFFWCMKKAVKHVLIRR